jgi:hypothetical protein
MSTRICTSVPNSVVLVMDQAIGVIPDSMKGKLIATSPSSIAVGTVSEIDQMVEIDWTDESLEIDEQMQCVISSSIATPNWEVGLCSVHHEKLLSVKVQGEVSDVEVWVNHVAEPDRIIIAVRTASHP